VACWIQWNRTNPWLRLEGTCLRGASQFHLPARSSSGSKCQKYHDESGLTYGKIYRLAELRDPSTPFFHSFKSYDAIAVIIAGAAFARFPEEGTGNANCF
jgi:hypothetical protein